MERVKIEIDLHRARIWQLEAYSSLPAAVLSAPVTIDEVAMGEESYAQMFSLLASINEDQLANTVITRGPTVRQSVGEQLATLAGHDRQHWGWAIQGLADRASRG